MSEEDKASVVDALVEEMSELFHGYIGGDIPFDELTFEMYDTLQTLHAITSNNLTIEYYDEAGNLDGDTFEDLAGEPVRENGNGSGKARGSDKKRGKRSGN
jgi:hypothetical protein